MADFLFDLFSCEEPATSRVNLPLILDLFFNDVQEEKNIKREKKKEGRKRKENSEPSEPSDNPDDLRIPVLSDPDFVKFFRMSRSTFEVLLTKLHEAWHRGRGRIGMPVESQVLMVLWYLGNPRESFRSISERFNVKVCNFYECLWRIIRLIERIQGEFIVWPSKEDALKAVGEFKRSTGFPGVVGALGTCHITLNTRLGKRKDQYSHPQKEGHFLTVLGVCDENRMFMHVECGLPRGMSNAAAYYESSVAPQLAEILPAGCHLVANVSYPLQDKLMVPFRYHEVLKNSQKNYNDVLVNATSAIDECFTGLKRRWRILDQINMLKVEDIPSLIVACCCLHNLAVSQGEEACDPDSGEEVEVVQECEFDEEDNGSALRKRKRICSHLAGDSLSEFLKFDHSYTNRNIVL